MSSPLQSSEYCTLPVPPSPLHRHQTFTGCGSLGLALCVLVDRLSPRSPSSVDSFVDAPEGVLE